MVYYCFNHSSFFVLDIWPATHLEWFHGPSFSGSCGVEVCSGIFFVSLFPMWKWHMKNGRRKRMKHEVLHFHMEAHHSLEEDGAWSRSLILSIPVSCVQGSKANKVIPAKSVYWQNPIPFWSSPRFAFVLSFQVGRFSGRYSQFQWIIIVQSTMASETTKHSVGYYVCNDSFLVLYGTLVLQTQPFHVVGCLSHHIFLFQHDILIYSYDFPLKRAMFQ